MLRPKNLDRLYQSSNDIPMFPSVGEKAKWLAIDENIRK